MLTPTFAFSRTFRQTWPLLAPFCAQFLLSLSFLPHLLVWFVVLLRRSFWKQEGFSLPRLQRHSLVFWRLNLAVIFGGPLAWLDPPEGVPPVLTLSQNPSFSFPPSPSLTSLPPISPPYPLT